MKDSLKKAKDSFSTELSTKGDVWRIFRKKTFVDLIRLSFFSFLKDSNKDHIIDIINYAIKVKLLSTVKAIELTGGLEGISQKLNCESEFILNKYDSIINQLQLGANDSFVIGELLISINHLDEDDNQEKNFEEIIKMSFAILTKE